MDRERRLYIECTKYNMYRATKNICLRYMENNAMIAMIIICMLTKHFRCGLKPSLISIHPNAIYPNIWLWGRYHTQFPDGVTAGSAGKRTPGGWFSTRPPWARSWVIESPMYWSKCIWNSYSIKMYTELCQVMYSNFLSSTIVNSWCVVKSIRNGYVGIHLECTVNEKHSPVPLRANTHL